jgi:hypothetical protein
LMSLGHQSVTRKTAPRSRCGGRWCVNRAARSRGCSRTVPRRGSAPCDALPITSMHPDQRLGSSARRTTNNKSLGF